MKIKNPGWMRSTTAIVVLSYVITMLEPAAFGKDPENTPPQPESVTERASETVTPATLPNRPVFTVVQAVTQPQAPAVTQGAVRVPEIKPHPQGSRKSKKWILIVAAAGAAGIAAFLTRGNGEATSAPTPTITVGAPAVGQPQ
jgi:hypothetical protein